MTAFGRVSVMRALAWIDAASRCLGAEDVALDGAAGRVLAEDIRTAHPIPPVACAATDGYAVPAVESLGAGAYNPLAFPEMPVAAGDALPDGTDAVVPFDQAEPGAAGQVMLVEPVVAGANVAHAASVAAADALLIAAGGRLTPRHVGLLALAGCSRTPVIRRPNVRLVIAGKARSRSPIDANRPMLSALIERDGGAVSDAALADAFGPGADIVLVAGGTGHGREDRTAAALAASGALDIHGVALFPGETAGFGHTAAGTPVLLLPGVPAACLWSYELFAGRAIRRLGGRDPAFPYPSRLVVIARKIVSAIGVTEICPIRRLPDGRVERAASFAEAGLVAAVHSDGFTIVAEASEGYPAGAQITAYFYDEVRDEEHIRAEPRP